MSISSKLIDGGARNGRSLMKSKAIELMERDNNVYNVNGRFPTWIFSNAVSFKRSLL